MTPRFCPLPPSQIKGLRDTGGNEQVDRSPLTVTDRVQLGVHAAFGPTNQATTSPFLAAMLVAVR